MYIMGLHRINFGVEALVVQCMSATQRDACSFIHMHTYVVNPIQMSSIKHMQCRDARRCRHVCGMVYRGHNLGVLYGPSGKIKFL